MIPENWAERPPPPPDEGKFFDTRSIHFRQFWATLVFVAEKPPPLRMRENFLTSDLSISGNFEQLWFLWQKSHPHPGWGKIFWHQIYPFQAILSNFGFCGRKAPLPRMRGNFWTPDLSTSVNFEQLWFLWQKSPTPQDEGKFLDTRSIHFRTNFEQVGFCGRKAPLPPSAWDKIFWYQIYPFQPILSNFDFCGRKATPPHRMTELFWHQIYPFQCNIEQLWPMWQP